MVQGTVNGTSVTATAIRDGVMRSGPGRNPGVFGTVASINGTTLIVTSKVGPQGGSQTNYTVDASKATVTKNGASSSVSNIAVGDTVAVQGALSGTSITATSIRDGAIQKQKTQPNPSIQGNGEPVVGGSVTAINGSTITVTNKSNITYTIDASSATVEKAGAISSISNVAIGDNVIVQGTVNGTSITASSVIDQGSATNASANSSNGAPNVHKGFMSGLLGSIGGFFKHLFGFF
jgi:hypothetical protein